MDQSSAIAKRLFAHLVMVARGEASDTDKFVLNQATPPAPESSLPARPKSFGSSDNKMDLLKPEWLLEENPLPSQERPMQSHTPLSQQLPQQPLQAQQPFLQQMPPQQPRPQQTPLQQQSPSQQSQQQQLPGQAQHPQSMPRQSQENQSQTGPQQFFANQQQAAPANPYGAPQGYPAPMISGVNAPVPTAQGQAPASQNKPHVQDLLQQNLVLVLNECNQFAGALDQQLELLTPIGVKSIQDQDMETASEIMQRAKRLKALLDAVVTFTNEWKSSSK